MHSFILAMNHEQRDRHKRMEKDCERKYHIVGEAETDGYGAVTRFINQLFWTVHTDFCHVFSAQVSLCGFWFNTKCYGKFSRKPLFKHCICRILENFLSTWYSFCEEFSRSPKTKNKKKTSLKFICDFFVCLVFCRFESFEILRQINTVPVCMPHWPQCMSRLHDKIPTATTKICKNVRQRCKVRGRYFGSSLNCYINHKAHM